MTIKMVRREYGAEYILAGKLDTLTAPEAEDILLEALNNNPRLVLNFKDLVYISSAGLRLLKRLYMENRKAGHELVISHVGKLVMEVIEMTGMAGLFTFE